MVIGAITALFMGFLGIIQNDIKRVVAYSTLSQLGYMTVALGASAYSVAIFHLMTHAFFKALLFLAAGSVIIGMHHEQDIRNMGGLRKYMPITWITSLIGSLALIGTPFLSGFYSKDSIIEAAALSEIPGSGFAYFAVLAGVFVTAFYSFRMYFLVFHGEERFRKAHHDDHGHDDHGHGDVPHESRWVVTFPLVMLAIPSLFIGYLTVRPMLYGSFFKGAIFVDAATHPVMHELAHHFHSAAAMGLHAFTSLPFLLAASGVGLSWFFYLKRPDIPEAIKQKFSVIYSILENKYGFDAFNEKFFAGGARWIGGKLWQIGDVQIIDGTMVNGTARLIGRISAVVRQLQSGLIYHYAFAMIIGAFVLLTWFMKV
jgi:proton-translocating NADH-quinone oxidoreductase, chain L